MTDYYRERPAGFWIGHPGALLPLPGIKGSLTRSVDRAVTYKTAASGRRRAYLAARREPLREWKVTIPRMEPQESAVLLDLVMGTDPPYVWVDPWSRVTNLLTPTSAALTDSVPALAPLGRQPLAGGGWAPSAGANVDGGSVLVSPAPVVEALPVTVSAYVLGGSVQVTAVFLDSAGVPVGPEVTSAPVSASTALVRASATAADPPTGAAAVAIRVDGASVVAMPAVTWTDYLTAYGPGGGVAQVIVPALDEALRAAELAAAGDRLVDVSFSVYEVG